MRRDELLAVALAPELAATVHDAVASGDYASPDEIVSEALQRWSTDRSFAGSDAERVRGLWDTGLHSGRGALRSIDDIKREARLERDASNAV